MLVCLSANHRSAGFSLLEKLSGVPVADLEAAIAAAPGITGGVVLSTCNRFELYLDLEGVCALDDFFARLAVTCGVAEDDLRAHVRVHGDADVAEYLFAVSAGLESVAIGEDEIAGQVRRALTTARRARLTTSELEKLFQTAAAASKGVKQRTQLSGQGRSLVSLALDLAASQVRDWARADIVLVGTGAYAGASLAALEARGARRIGVYSPSGRAHTFAERYDVAPIDEGRLGHRLANADLVITCTSTDDYVLDYDLVRNARIAPGAAERQLIVDLGLPRNVDPLVAKLDSVDLLDLETLRLHAPMDDLGATELARCIVARAAKEFDELRLEQRAATAIAAFRTAVQERVETEIVRANGDPDVEIAMRQLGNALLHGPTLRIKELARQGRADEVAHALDLLFGVQVPADEPAMPAVDPSGLAPTASAAPAPRRCPLAPAAPAEHAAPAPAPAEHAAPVAPSA